ncbi:MAG: hypothetical protein IPJ71_19640 [Bdellovibrionales bacterium]|nr:hypothetical protein [Bdellovibrionales bacterium]
MNRVVTVADIAKKIKEAITKEFPDYKFGVSSSNFAGGCSVSISLLGCAFEVYANGPVLCTGFRLQPFLMTPKSWGTGTMALS